MRLDNFQIITGDFTAFNANVMIDSLVSTAGGIPDSIDGFKTFFTLREDAPAGSLLSANHYIIASANDFNDTEKWSWSIGSGGYFATFRVFDALSANPDKKDNEARYVQGDFLFVGKLTKTS